PAAVCRQLAPLASKGTWGWRDGVLIAGLLAAMMAFNHLFWWKFVGWLFIELFGRGNGPNWLGLLLCIMPPALVAGLLMMTVYTVRFNRLFRKFSAEPFCLNCRYPVSATAADTGSPICPECGEPIPPEIAELAAKLAAERAGNDARG